MGVFKVDKWDNRCEGFSLEDYKQTNGIYYLHKEHINMYRLATDEEIEDFENRRKKYLAIKKKIDKKQEELHKLYKEL